MRRPWRTWNGANAGARMLFGFGSTSLDWWAYAHNFFLRWNTGVSFSQAWQEASLSLTHDQIVSSTGCGATREEAQNRLWNERLFSGERRTQVGMRFAKIFRFGSTRTDIGVDVGNLLNTNYATNWENTYQYSIGNAGTGGSWNNPTAVYTPRFVRLNFTVNF